MSHLTPSKQSPRKPWENLDTTEKTGQTSNSVVTTMIPTDQQRPLPSLSENPYYSPSMYGATTSYMPRFSSYNQSHYGYNSYPSLNFGHRTTYGGYDPSTMMVTGSTMIPNSMSLSQHMEASSREAFRLIDTIVQAVGGFAQMLDSTFYATYSSFMAMVSVAEQFTHMKEYLTSVFSVFVLYRNLKKFVYFYILRRNPPLALNQVTHSEFQKFEQETQQDLGRSRISRTPVLLFLAATFGLPYLLSKLIKIFRSIEEQRQKAYYEKLQNHLPKEVAIALHDFEPQMEIDLPFKVGNHLNILLRTDPATGQPVQWWKAELEGRVGYIPCNYVRLLESDEMKISH